MQHLKVPDGFTETYIAMCRAAPEVQEARRNLSLMRPGDWFHTRPLGTFMVWDERRLWVAYPGSGEYLGGRVPARGRIWLPRLDQLVHLSGYNRQAWIVKVFRIYERGEYHIDPLSASLEVAALHLVMDSRYNKRWVEKSWRGTRTRSIQEAMLADEHAT